MNRSRMGGVPCSSRVADGAIQGAAYGSIWGLIVGPYDAAKIGCYGLDRIKSTVIYSTRSCLAFGFIGGLYCGFTCGLETLRRKSDWVNPSVGGALTGAIFASKSRSLTQILKWSTTMGAISSLGGGYFYPVEHLPKEELGE